MHMRTTAIPRKTWRGLGALGLVMSAGLAWAQQPAQPAYEPPPHVPIAPAPGQNPYLMYVPAQPPAPQDAAPATPQAEATAPQADATAPRPQERSLADMGRSLRNYFTDEEMDLLLQYMKESVVAAFKGEEVALPPDLAFKLEVLLVRLRKEGGMYMDNLAKQLERDLKRALQEKLVPPPAAPQDLPPTTPAMEPAPPPAPSGASSRLRAVKPQRNS